NQHLYFQYEVYDPGFTSPSFTSPSPNGVMTSVQARSRAASIAVVTSIAFFSGKTHVFETPLIEATRIDDVTRQTAVFRFDVPVSALRPGAYICQVNVIDTATRKFTFRRIQLVVQP